MEQKRIFDTQISNKSVELLSLQSVFIRIHSNKPEIYTVQTMRIIFKTIYSQIQVFQSIKNKFNLFVNFQ